ncbi:potassium-transporting ATPase subunit KdpB [Kitasatospora sp. NPDC059811]|uniref:potassium-transporting ATPase subunit KdpB n=1 Tax=Kitasatospora sp. NPDC059811 TaxID=3346957 RepID=UPI0036604EC9
MRRSALTPPDTTTPRTDWFRRPEGVREQPPHDRPNDRPHQPQHHPSHRPTGPDGGRRRLITRRQLTEALPAAVRKLHPRTMMRNPVMLVVETGSALTTLSAVIHPSVFAWVIGFWLWLTVLFANLAEAVAESRGKAQAESLRRTQAGTTARRLLHWRVGTRDHRHEVIPAEQLMLHDVVLVPAGEVVPQDGEVVEGVASVDESAITGESAPVIRESGGDRTGVTGGTRVLSDHLVVRVTSRPGQSFVDRMIALVEGANRQKTPNEIALNILLASLTIVFLLSVVSLQPMAIYAHAPQTTVVLVALMVALIPTTIGALLSAIGIAGMDRLVQRNVVALSGRAVEAAGDVDVLLLDKTGTITHGNRRAVALHPLPGASTEQLAEAAQLASLADETPEGRSLVELTNRQYWVPPRAPGELGEQQPVPFTAHSRMSGVDLTWPDGTNCLIRKGAAGAVARWVVESGGRMPMEAKPLVDRIAEAGGTPLLVAVHDRHGARALGVVELKDVVKEGIAERFAELRRMGIRTVMVTGDNPLTARAIAAEAGVDDFLAEATPEDKLAHLRREQAAGNMVAMTGDGTNDAPALAQADVGVAMNSGTPAAKEAGNMVDLDSNPAKLIDIIRVGKQLLITRGALTTFSITNDVAKFFAIIPAMFANAYPGLHHLNIMELHSPTSAIASAIIFNALIIVALIPLALRGVRYQPASATDLLRRNLRVYGLGGLILPFLGIKAIDLLIQFVPGLG